ncbi:putative peroxisomal dehydratase [Rosellinia necatrix]|uniref:Putative peroxisomal dehydratase n=1 Tax=Rosellinia necatrix TaxID=77044 RepID=A0A1W2TFY6_ROSNE|nr:putative peroxisomal dehydratase [Rosellinia necatrix]
MGFGDQPIKRADGRYDNVDFHKAVGHKFRAIKCAYNRRDVLLFANAIGAQADERHFLYELHPRFAAFPTFPTNLALKQTDQDVFDPLARAAAAEEAEPVPGMPPPDARRSVDGERGIEVVSPVPTSSAGLDLEIRGRVLGVYDEGGAVIAEREHDLVDARTGRVYVRMTSTTLGIGQGGYGGPRWPKAPVAKTPARQPDVVHAYRTTPETALLYRLCGDYSPVHADDELGRRAGFKRATLQSLCTWNIAAHGLLRGVADSDPARLKAFRARFNSAVYPGDELETLIWKTGSEDIYDNYVFETIVKGDGRVALSNGHAKIRQQRSMMGAVVINVRGNPP